MIEKNTEEIERIRKEKEPVIKEEVAVQDKGKAAKGGAKGKEPPKGKGAPAKGKDVKQVEEAFTIAQ